jgi:hypothetical protein
MRKSSSINHPHILALFSRQTHTLVGKVIEPSIKKSNNKRLESKVAKLQGNVHEGEKRPVEAGITPCFMRGPKVQLTHAGREEPFWG